MRNVRLAAAVVAIGFLIGPILATALFATANVGVEMAMGGWSEGVRAIRRFPEMMMAVFLVSTPIVLAFVGAGSFGLAAAVLLRGPVGYGAAFLAGAIAALIGGPVVYFLLQGRIVSDVPSKMAVDAAAYLALAVLTGLGSMIVRALCRGFGLFRARDVNGAHA